MARFSNRIMIACPVNEVFRFVADFENMPKWNYYVVQVTRITPGPVGIGTTFKQLRKTDSQQYRIIAFEPNRKVTVEASRSALELVMSFTFEPTDGMTNLTDEWELNGGLFGLFGSLATGQIKSAVAENLTKLKQLLETGTVRLQDGRVERA